MDRLSCEHGDTIKVVYVRESMSEEHKWINGVYYGDNKIGVYLDITINSEVTSVFVPWHRIHRIEFK